MIRRSEENDTLNFKIKGKSTTPNTSAASTTSRSDEKDDSPAKEGVSSFLS